MFSILFLLVTGVFSVSYTFDNITVTIDTVSNTSIYSSDGTNKCNKIIARTSELYHLSSEGAFQSWPKTTLTPQTNSVTSVLPGVTIHDMDVSNDELTSAFVTSDPVKGRLINTMNPDHTINSQTTYFNLHEGIHIATDGTYDYFLSVDSVSTSSTHLYVMQGNTTIHDYVVALTFINVAISPNFKTAVVWGKQTQFKFIDLITGTMSITYGMPTIPAFNSTKKITFSQDSSKVLIETDNYNPILVFDAVNFALNYLIYVYDVVYETHFLNSSNDYVVVFGQAAMVFVDLINATQYTLPTIQATAYDLDYSNNIYTCTNNLIEGHKITYGLTPDNTTRSNNATVAPQQTTKNIEESFYIVVDPPSEKFYGMINSTLSTSSQASSIVASIASSLPIGIYFLSFINYFSLCSLYVLLNFPIPKQVYQYLANVYEQLNQSLLAIFGVQVNLGPYSDERVNTDRAIFFGVSSDVTTSNSIIFMFLGANIAFILLLNWLFSFCRKNNPLRVIVSKQKWNMIFGNIINIILPLTLPWTFFLLESGVRNFGTKMNSACYIILYFVGLVFPIYYFFDLLQDREQALIEERQQRIRSQEKEKKEKEAKQKEAKKDNVVIYYSRDMSKFQTENKHAPIDSASSKNDALNQKQQRITNNARVESNKKEQIELLQSKQRVDTRHKAIKLSNLDSLKKKNSENQKLLAEPCIKHYKLQLIYGESSENTEERKPELKQKEKNVKVGMKKLLTIDIIEQWYLCQANFIFPSLVLLSNPIYFLVVIQLFTFLGAFIAFKKKQMRLNSFILSLYPLLFHSCFVVFYFGSSLQIISIAETVCLSIFMMGVVHQCLTVAYEIIVFTINSFRMIIGKKRNQIVPKEREITRQLNKKKCRKQNKVRKVPQASFLKPPPVNMLIKKSPNKRQSNSLEVRQVRQSISKVNRIRDEIQ